MPGSSKWRYLDYLLRKRNVNATVFLLVSGIYVHMIVCTRVRSNMHIQALVRILYRKYLHIYTHVYKHNLMNKTNPHVYKHKNT